MASRKVGEVSWRLKPLFLAANVSRVVKNVFNFPQTWLTSVSNYGVRKCVRRKYVHRRYKEDGWEELGPYAYIVLWLRAKDKLILQPWLELQPFSSLPMTPQ